MQNACGLGRLAKPDPRDRLHLMRSALPGAAAHTKIWRAGTVLDQGDTSQCTAYAWTAFLQSSPMMTYNAYRPALLYEREQAIDGWPLPHDGSSVRAGAKVLQEDGRLSEYVWAFNAADARSYIVQRGPVVLGTDWYESMFTPSKLGYIEPGGDIVGGHAYLCVGYDLKRDAFRIVNSWGRTWGQLGRAWLPFDALDALMRDDGEACSAIEKRPS